MTLAAKRTDGAYLSSPRVTNLKAGGVEVLQEFVLLVDWLLTSGDLCN